jgi:hypothetical protein
VAIAFRAGAKADTANATTFNVAKPTGFASTDILVVVLGWSSTGSPTLTVPTGWTQIFGISGDTTIGGACYRALGSVASVAFALSVSRDNGMVCLAFTGVDNTTPVDATGTATVNTGAATNTAAAVTVVTANAWHLIACSDWNGGMFTATGFTQFENANPPLHESACCLYNTTPKGTGSTGTVSVADSASATSQHILTMPFALRPAAGGAGPVAAPAAMMLAMHRVGKGHRRRRGAPTPRAWAV